MPLGGATGRPRKFRYVARSAGAKLTLAQPDVARTIQASPLLNLCSRTSDISKIFEHRETNLIVVVQCAAS
eukprot:8923838-Pyramimonas_sp.AAC.1